jgi:lipopolysaccharide export system permease protein
VLAITLFGEFVVPHATRYAEIFRESAITGNQTVTTPQGTWIRDGLNFIRVKQILPDGELLGVIRYEFNEQRQLQSATYAERAKYSTQQKQWQMYDVKQTTLSKEGVTVLTAPEQTWKADIKPSLVNILIEQPDSLSILGLLNYIDYLRDNQLRTQEYALALWKKLWQPMATLVMIFISIPVILGPLRSATMGLRLLTGVMLGFGFYILNQLFGPLSLVYSSFPPILAASLPSLLFALGGFLLLKRVR